MGVKRREASTESGFHKLCWPIKSSSALSMIKLVLKAMFKGMKIPK